MAKSPVVNGEIQEPSHLSPSISPKGEFSSNFIFKFSAHLVSEKWSPQYFLNNLMWWSMCLGKIMLTEHRSELGHTKSQTRKDRRGQWQSVRGTSTTHPEQGCECIQRREQGWRPQQKGPLIFDTVLEMVSKRKDSKISLRFMS